MRREEAADPARRARWTYKEQKTSTGWLFECVMLTDPLIRQYRSFRITVSVDGTIVIEKCEPLANWGAYI